jgi:hypothetical protein
MHTIDLHHGKVAGWRSQAVGWNHHSANNASGSYYAACAVHHALERLKRSALLIKFNFQFIVPKHQEHNRIFKHLLAFAVALELSLSSQSF